MNYLEAIIRLARKYSTEFSPLAVKALRQQLRGLEEGDLKTLFSTLVDLAVEKGDLFATKTAKNALLKWSELATPELVSQLIKDSSVLSTSIEILWAALFVTPHLITLPIRDKMLHVALTHTEMPIRTTALDIMSLGFDANTNFITPNIINDLFDITEKDTSVITSRHALETIQTAFKGRPQFFTDTHIDKLLGLAENSSVLIGKHIFPVLKTVVGKYPLKSQHIARLFALSWLKNSIHNEARTTLEVALKKRIIMLSSEHLEQAIKEALFNEDETVRKNALTTVKMILRHQPELATATLAETLLSYARSAKELYSRYTALIIIKAMLSGRLMLASPKLGSELENIRQESKGGPLRPAAAAVKSRHDLNVFRLSRHRPNT